jgi:hypothetical protein
MRIRMIIVLFFLTLPVADAVADVGDWTGVWDTHWPGGGAVMELRQDGNRVVGNYPGFEGVIDGSVEAGRLSGTWTDSAGSGEFIFTLSPNGGASWDASAAH